MTYRAVFFDVGETLMHPHPSFPLLFAATLRENGYPVPDDRAVACSRVVSKRFEAAHAAGDLWTTSPEGSRRFWLGTYTEMLEQLGIRPADGLIDRLFERFTQTSNYRLFDDVLPVLRRLRASGRSLGIISNFEAWLPAVLERLGVGELMAASVISGLVGIEKPDPRIFRLAMERTGVEPAEAVHVGDSPSFDTAPAEALGMGAVLLDRRRRYPDHAGARIESLYELEAVGVS